MKKALALLIGLSAALFARAEGDLMMYWMIDQRVEDASPKSFTYAMIALSGDGIEEGTYLSVDGKTVVIPSDFEQKTFSGSFTEPIYTSLGTLASHNPQTLYFAVELYAGDPTAKVGYSEAVSYAELLAGGHIYGDMWTTGITPYVFTVVPEPTGGVLVLLGLGLLGLRRKRV